MDPIRRKKPVFDALAQAVTPTFLGIVRMPGSAVRMILVFSRAETCAVKGRNLLRIVFLNFSSGTRFAFELDDVNDHPGDVVLAKFRTDQHVVQVRIVPIATEIHADEVGALLIG